MWAEHGLDPATFWSQTPRTFAAIIEGRSEAIQRDYEVAIMNAWRTVNYGNMKRLPDLSRELRRKSDPPVNQTPGEMIATMRAWVQATGQAA